MQLTIDSFDHRGAVDYTFYLDAERLPKIVKASSPAKAS